MAINFKSIQDRLGELGMVLRHSAVPSVTPREGWISADLHVHSEYSPDSEARLKVIIDSALEKGLDLMAITDHFIDRSFYELKNRSHEILGDAYDVASSEVYNIVETENKRLIIVKGKEVSTAEDFHVLALGYVGQIHNFKPLDGTLIEINQKKGIAIIPHPCHSLSHGIGRRNLESLLNTPRSRNRIAAIESFNANSYFPTFWGNKIASEIGHRLDFPMISSSDAHQSRHIGRAHTQFQGKLNFGSTNAFVSSLETLLSQSHREQIMTYVPFSEFWDWFLWPKIKGVVSGKPLKIKPPPGYEEF